MRDELVSEKGVIAGTFILLSRPFLGDAGFFSA
jgi:hypothetical protein